MDFQDVAELTIPEGEVRNIHDTDSRLLWSAVGYDVDYRGDIEQASYMGKNLFNKDTTPQGGYFATYSALSTGVRVTAARAINYTFIRYVFNVESYVGQTITMSAIATPSASNTPGLAIGTCDSDGNNRVSKGIKVGSGSISVSYTIESGVQYIYIAMYSNQVGTASIGDYVDYENAQLELSASLTSYEPYTGGQPSPSPDFPQEIHTVTEEQTVTVSGKNLLGVPDGERATGGVTFTRINNTITCSGTWTSSSTWAIMAGSNFIILDNPLPAGTYTLSISEPTTKNLEMTIRDSNGGIISLTSGSTTLRAGRTSTTFTTPVEVGRYRLVCPSLTAGEVLNGVAYKNIQVEAGSVSTAYEAYQSAAYTINLGTTELCKIGGYQDYIYKGSDGWYVHKEIRKRILDGTETWGTSTYQGVRFFYLDTTDGLTSSNSQVVVLSDLFLGQWGGANNTIVFSANSATPRRMMIFTNDIGTTTSEWKTWLGSNNVLTYYALETPTDTKITDSTLVSQLDAVHNRITRYDYQYTISGNLPIIINRTGLT